MSEGKCNHYDTGGICCSDGAFKYKYCKDINDCYYKQLQTAKAEINRLNNVCDNCGYDVYLKTLSHENALLLEENNNLKEQRRILKGTIKKFNLDWYGEELDTLTQQNKQMREALEKIVKIDSNSVSVNGDYPLRMFELAQNIAQQALKGGQ